MTNQITSNHSKISNSSRNKPILSQETINQIMSDDVYTRLGVPRNSSIDAIKKHIKDEHYWFIPINVIFQILKIYLGD